MDETKETKPSIAARCCADEVIAFLADQEPPWERQPWAPPARAELIKIIDRWVRQ